MRCRNPLFLIMMTGALLWTMQTEARDRYAELGSAKREGDGSAVRSRPSVEPSPVTEPVFPHEEGVYSYGDESASLFFNPKALDNYLKVIRLFEENGSSASSRINPADIKDKALQAIIQRIDKGPTQKPEPIIYPYYHLGSILFHARNSWALTINGIVITEKTNKADNELYATSVQPNRATFIWKPQDRRLVQDLTLHARDASQKRDKTLDHRKVRRLFGQPLVNGNGSISFALEPNQLFYSEFLTVYEGGSEGIIPPPPLQKTVGVPGSPVAPIAPVAAIAQVPAAVAPVGTKLKKRNALNSFSTPDEVVPAAAPPVPVKAATAPAAATQAPAAAAPVSPNLARAPFAPVAVPAASTLAPITAASPAVPAVMIAPGSITGNASVPSAKRSSNEIPLEELPSIDTIAP